MSSHERAALSRAAVLRLLGRDSGVNFPCAEMLAAARPADETELGLARAYLDKDLGTDRQIWRLLRDSSLTSTQWEAGGEGGGSLLGSVRMSARLPHPHQAQRTAVVRVEKFLSAEDIAAIWNDGQGIDISLGAAGQAECANGCESSNVLPSHLTTQLSNADRCCRQIPEPRTHARANVRA